MSMFTAEFPTLASGQSGCEFFSCLDKFKVFKKVLQQFALAFLPDSNAKYLHVQVFPCCHFCSTFVFFSI